MKLLVFYIATMGKYDCNYSPFQSYKSIVEHFNLGMTTDPWKEKSEFKSVVPRLNIDDVLLPARGG